MNKIKNYFYKIAVRTPIVTLLVILSTILILYTLMSFIYVIDYQTIKGEILVQSTTLVDSPYIKLCIDINIEIVLSNSTNIVWYKERSAKRFNVEGQMAFDHSSNTAYLHIHKDDFKNQFDEKTEIYEVYIQIDCGKQKLLYALLEALERE